ncbi:peptidylprolyl isomerase [Pelagibacterium sediminicola]|uniref:peptidylprolyl isomerase n=1 Tax=Pelagibacterium sediminicola TaxID=2248761 RepID=UPI001300624E|nr:peptidylprolyl isomerase [Pelagibacterium sediminicola]
MSFSLAARLSAAVRGFAVPLVLVAGLGVAPAIAQDETSPDTVVATVGGEPITEADLMFAAEDLAAELQSIPPTEHRAFLLTVMIDMKVMANAAREAELDQSDIFARRLDYLEERSLRRAFFAEVVEAGVTDEAVEAAYEEMVAGFEAQPEVRARHILVPTLEEAQLIRAEIEGGKSFEDAATEYGTDGTRATGGDLGYFSSGMMVAPFEEAAFALETGQLSEPVESQFGWHLIKLEDRRVTTAPTLDQVRQQVAQQVLYDNFSRIVGDLKAETEIDIPDADLAEAVEAQGGL